MNSRGFNRFNAKLKDLNNRINRAIANEINVAGTELQKIIRKDMKETPKTGRTYKRGEKTHTASSAGNAPAVDTGELIKSIQIFTKAIPSRLFAEVGSDTAQGKWMEYGTSNIEARPWLRPAFDRNKEQIQKNIQEAIEKELRRS